MNRGQVDTGPNSREHKQAESQENHGSKGPRWEPNRMIFEKFSKRVRESFSIKKMGWAGGVWNGGVSNPAQKNCSKILDCFCVNRRSTLHVIYLPMHLLSFDSLLNLNRGFYLSWSLIFFLNFFLNNKYVGKKE